MSIRCCIVFLSNSEVGRWDCGVQNSKCKIALYSFNNARTTASKQCLEMFEVRLSFKARCEREELTRSKIFYKYRHKLTVG